jgi:3-dehydroquinate synthase
MEAQSRPSRETRFGFGSTETRVTFWNGMLPTLKGCIVPKDRPVVVACDDNTLELGAGYLASEENGTTVTLAPGEQGKSWESVSAIYRSAIGAGLGRDGCIVGVGGGVVCDVAAFAASTYMRGVLLKLMPTTLLAMVDAALGGKTGINFGGFKNMVGTFYPAEEVAIVPSVLASLPEREYRSGLAEVIKSAMLGDEKLFRFLQQAPAAVIGREQDAVINVVERSIAVKGAVVEADLTEQGNRAILNLGHTFAHALESVSEFSGYTHGEAVGWGIAQALRAGLDHGMTDRDYAQESIELLRTYGFETELKGVPVERLLEAMLQDKKKRDGRVRFVLQRTLGQTELVELDLDRIRRLLKQYAG